MTNETDKVDYVDNIVALMCGMTDESAREIASDLWHYYPTETIMLLMGLNATQHQEKRSALLRKP